jgi:hypothetical protein
MFSGLTNQVSSWMSKPHDEEVPAPPATETAEKPEVASEQPVQETPVEANDQNGQKSR